MDKVDGTPLGGSFLPDAQYIVPDHDSMDDQDGALGGDDDCNDPRGKDEPLREQDRFLPIANVARIMKKCIPKTGKIAKDARECVQECVSEFISFVTSEASDRCHQEKRKTINGEDILFAMNSLGFESYVEPLKLYLQKYREAVKGDKNLAGGDYEDLGDDFTSSLGGATLIGTTDQNGQPTNVIYTTYTPTAQFHLT